jgi:hypothetical protein
MIEPINLLLSNIFQQSHPPERKKRHFLRSSDAGVRATPSMIHESHYWKEPLLKSAKWLSTFFVFLYHWILNLIFFESDILMVSISFLTE